MSKKTDFATIVFCGFMSTAGVSMAADFVRQKRWENIYDFQVKVPHAYFPRFGKVMTRLSEMGTEKSAPNWDGYGASPVTAEAVNHAMNFISILPNSVPSPTVGAESDGEVTIEWYQAPRQVLSVSVSPDGQLSYAALIGNYRSHGTRGVENGPPEDIIKLIDDVMAPQV